MPPRHTYWTIILEGKPTAFRAHTRDELAPTLRQLQARHPDAVLMWFARGRLWASQEQEASARTNQRRERRGPDWRPGGAHRDPRERFSISRDEKRRRFALRRRSGQAGQARRDRLEPRDRDKADGECPPGPAQGRPRGRDRPGGPKSQRPWQRDRPGGSGRERSRQGERRDDARGSRPGPNRGRRGPRGGGGSGGRGGGGGGRTR